MIFRELLKFYFYLFITWSKIVFLRFWFQFEPDKIYAAAMNNKTSRLHLSPTVTQYKSYLIWKYLPRSLLIFFNWLQMVDLGLLLTARFRPVELSNTSRNWRVDNVPNVGIFYTCIPAHIVCCAPAAVAVSQNGDCGKSSIIIIITVSPKKMGIMS